MVGAGDSFAGTRRTMNDASFLDGGAMMGNLCKHEVARRPASRPRARRRWDLSGTLGRPGLSKQSSSNRKSR